MRKIYGCDGEQKILEIKSCLVDMYTEYRLKIRDDNTLVSSESASAVIGSALYLEDCFPCTPSIVSTTIDEYNQYIDAKSAAQPSKIDLECYLEDPVFPR